MAYSLFFLTPFEKNFKNLSPEVKKAAKKTVKFLSENPRHPSLKTHKVQNAIGAFGGDVYEAYVTMKYRLTWEYGPDQGSVTLRNIDNHDQCLRNA